MKPQRREQELMDQKPKIGMPVHYVVPEGVSAGRCRAATITVVHTASGVVSLCVMDPTGLFFGNGLIHDDGGLRSEFRGGTWHWPSKCGN